MVEFLSLVQQRLGSKMYWESWVRNLEAPLSFNNTPKLALVENWQFKLLPVTSQVYSMQPQYHFSAHRPGQALYRITAFSPLKDPMGQIH